MSLELADTSVWARRRDPQIQSWFSAALVARELLMCDVVALEFLRGSHPRDYNSMALDLRTSPPWIHLDLVDWQRVFEVQSLLASAGPQAHRSVKIADLLVAAAAERANVTLVHYDQHFDVIGEVTRQPMRWIAPRGTLG